jgi:hypothetical protein
MLVRDKLTWEDVCSDQSLRDLPFKIELNRLNQIVMSPAHPRHSRLQSKISRILGDLLSDGEAIVELAIETQDSTKVPDVVWASKATIAHRSERAHNNNTEVEIRGEREDDPLHLSLPGITSVKSRSHEGPVTAP